MINKSGATPSGGIHARSQSLPRHSDRVRIAAVTARAALALRPHPASHATQPRRVLRILPRAQRNAALLPTTHTWSLFEKESL